MSRGRRADRTGQRGTNVVGHCFLLGILFVAVKFADGAKMTAGLVFGADGV